MVYTGLLPMRVSRPRLSLPLRVALAVSLAVGLALVGAGAKAKEVVYERLGVFARVLTYIENIYVEPVDPDQLIYGAIKGMLATLDPHSAFLTPAEYEALKADTGGEYGGVGLELVRERNAVWVRGVFDRSPAHRAGLRRGDRVTSVDGVSVAPMDLSEVVHRLRGPPGSEVKIEILREGFQRPRKYGVVREHVLVNPVSARLEGRQAVVAIRAFQERTVDHLREALIKLEAERGAPLDGLILDLRGNPGGLLEQATAVADLWLSEGLITTTRGRSGPPDEAKAHRAGTQAPYPLVVLVDGRSASASEIVAGALQDHGRALVVGERTFGKGSVQTVVDLEDGSGLKLTVARYYTPSGRSIQERGIEPDLVVTGLSGPTQREEDLERHLAHEEGAPGPDAPEAAQAAPAACGM